MSVPSILLLSCRSPFLDDSKIYPPLACLYLKSYIDAHLPGVTAVPGDDSYDLSDLLPIEPFDAVGLSIMTPQRHEAIRLATAIKSRWPEKITIAGGPHVKHYRAELEALSCFDYLVPLDGEEAIIGILSGRTSARVVSHTMTRAEIAAQPRPDRSSRHAVEMLSRYHYELGTRKATTLMTARGCPEQCTFCEDAMTTVRWSSVANIAAQLDDIAALGYRAVYIFDDLFAMSPHVIAPICQELRRRDLIYRCNVQARYFTKNGETMARLLADTGCYEVAFGAESGSQQILDAVRKRCTVGQNYQTVAYAKKHGLIVKAFIMLGLPGETSQTLAETEAFIRDAGVDDFQCAVYMPFRGTRIRQDLDSGVAVDLMMRPTGADGDVSGAYGIRGGETAYEVRTAALSSDDLRRFRDYLLATYRPFSHRAKWQDQDRFFEQALVPVEAIRHSNAPGEPVTKVLSLQR